MSVPEISVQELKKLMDNHADIFVLDVRNQDEYEICNLKGHLLPMKELPDRLNELDPEAHIVVHCHAGGRSRRAVQFLMEQHFKNVFNLRGGITAWANEIEPTMAKY